MVEKNPTKQEERKSDRSERFFAQEIIRKQILAHYHQEVPYSVEVLVEAFKEAEKLIKIYATIYVERKTQKIIMIGAKGHALTQLGTQARMALEAFFKKKIFLDLRIKLAPNWRKSKKMLEKFGYL